MTLEEFNKQMNIYSDEYNIENYDEWFEKVSKFQQKYMEEVISSYTYPDNDVEIVVLDLLKGATYRSESGNVIEEVDNKELAEKIDNVLWEEIGDYLLDYEVYEEDGKYCIDCMFAGNYVPYWDGWND